FDMIDATLKQIIHYNFSQDVIDTVREFEAQINKKVDAIKSSNRMILTYFNEYKKYTETHAVSTDVIEANNILLKAMCN
ncbi:hypothetical protein, partial [Pseudomonas silesiensis]|uniref:hypothetical protein n=1 Tax=Pseudomonas silesiensis TaxID=1853130 RepID=UPI0034D75C7B